MPETYFLQEACVRALHSIVARLDRTRDFQPYFKVILEPPLRYAHDSWDYCDMAGRYVDAFCLIRQLTGESAEEEEAGLRKFLLRMANPEDGLFYNQDGENSQYVVDMFCQSRVLIGLSTWYLDTGDSEILGYLQRLVHGLARIAERRENYAFYPRNLYRRGEWLEGGLFYEPKDLWTVKPGYGGTQLEGIMKYAEITGDEVALEFTGAYLRYFLEAANIVKEDGSFIGHLHSQGIVPTMIGAAMYAERTGDRTLLEQCERFMRFILSHCSSFGWVPDGIGWHTCETCAVGDVIHLAARLSRLGFGDFWYDIERIARNQLLENQFRDPALIIRDNPAAPGLEAILNGAFASWAHPNDLLGGPDIEGCCTGGGVRALYHVLQNIALVDAQNTLAIHMLFSIETESVRIESALPYEGNVLIQLKTNTPVKLRRPEGTDTRNIHLTLNGQAITPTIEGNYFILGNRIAGDRIEIHFPLPTTTQLERIAGNDYTVSWKGNSVIQLEPIGEKYPTYRRSSWLAPSAPSSERLFPPIGNRIRW